MSDIRAIRAAKNEALFREVNERISSVTNTAPGEEFGAVCECTNPACHDTVYVRPGEYEAIRDDATHFLVVPGHDDPPVEGVVERTDRYWVVEKVGKAAEEAAELDPRQ